MSLLPPNSNPTDSRFEIRQAQPQDAAAIARVHVLSWQAAYQGLLPQSLLDSLSIERRTDQWRQWLESPHEQHNLVVDQAGQLIGFVSGGPIRGDYPDYDCEIAAIYLLPEVQGKGCGKALFQAMQALLAQQGYQQMLVWVLESNLKSRGFYEALRGKQVLAKSDLIAGNMAQEIVAVAEVAYAWELRS